MANNILVNFEVLKENDKTLHKDLSIPFMYNDPQNEEQDESLNN